MSDHTPSFGRRKQDWQVEPALSRKPVEPKCYLQRRQEPMRTPQFKRVILVYNNGYSAANAILRDISDNGAKIQTEDGLHLPDTFTMKSPYEDFTKTCTRVWRDGKFIGVKFTP